MPEYIQPNNFEIESGAGSAQPEAGRAMNNFSEKVSFIWSVADLLRGDYKQSEYGRVILPFLVLRRLDQVLAPSREAVLAAAAKFPADKTPEALRERMLLLSCHACQLDTIGPFFCESSASVSGCA